MSGLSMANQLLEPGSGRLPRVPRRSTSVGVHFTTGAALVDGTSIPLATLNADSAQWGTPVYGLGSYPVSHYALRLPKIGVYTGGTTAPTNPTFHGTGDGQCTSTSYCEAMFDLSVKEKIPVSQLGQITSTDLANGVLISQGYTAFVNPGSTIAAGAGATALQNFVNAGGVYVGSVAGGTTSARNAGITLLNTSSISGLSTPGSTFDGVFSTATPAGWGFDTGGWIYRSASGDPTFNPETMVGNGTTIPTPTAVVTYGPSGDCGGPVFDISTTQRGYSNCYGHEVNANNTLPAANASTPLPGRPAVVDQPFGTGHAILIGFETVDHVDDAGGAARPQRRPLPGRPGDPGFVNASEGRLAREAPLSSLHRPVDGDVVLADGRAVTGRVVGRHRVQNLVAFAVLVLVLEEDHDEHLVGLGIVEGDHLLRVQALGRVAPFHLAPHLFHPLLGDAVECDHSREHVDPPCRGAGCGNPTPKRIRDACGDTTSTPGLPGWGRGSTRSDEATTHVREAEVESCRSLSTDRGGTMHQESARKILAATFTDSRRWLACRRCPWRRHA